MCVKDYVMDACGKLTLVDFFAFNLSEQITRLTSIVNELSLPFCRLVVRYLHSKDNRDVTTSSECLSPLYDVALNEIKLSIDQGCQLWPELFEASMDRLMNKVRLCHSLCFEIV